jgi:hypothetical protein
MRKLGLVLLLAFGCSKDVTKDIENLADRSCACKDKACAEKVLDDLVALAEKNKDAHGDEDRAKAAAERIGKCSIEAGVDLDTLQKKLDKMGKD